jgi:hypothetical protein
MRISMRSWLPGLLAGAVTVLSAVALTPVSAQAFPESFQISNKGSGLCLEPDYLGNGAPVRQQPCDRSHLGQNWETALITASDNIFVLDHTFCLDERDGVNADRTVVQLWTCTPSLTQFWALKPADDHFNFFRLVSRVGSRCLDVAAGSLDPGAQLQIYHCTAANDAQVFSLN